MNKNAKIKNAAQRAILFALVTVMICSLALVTPSAEGNADINSATVIAQTVEALPSLGELTELEEYIRKGLENDNNNTDWMILAISRAGYELLYINYQVKPFSFCRERSRLPPQ